MNISRPGIIVFRISLAAALSGILILATTPLEFPVASGINDKVNHIYAFIILALLADFSFPEKKLNISVILSLFGYGLAIEVIQHFLPYRMFSLFDVAADALGLTLYKISVPLLKEVINSVSKK